MMMKPLRDKTFDKEGENYGKISNLILFQEVNVKLL